MMTAGPAIEEGSPNDIRYVFVLLTPIHRNEYAVVDRWSGEIVERGMYRHEAVARASELNGYEGDDD